MRKAPYVILLLLVFSLYGAYLKAQDSNSIPAIAAESPPGTILPTPSAETPPPPDQLTAPVGKPLEGAAVDNLEKQTPSAKVSSPQPPVEMPQAQPGSEAFTYDPTGKRDPFDSETPKPPEEVMAEQHQAPPPPQRPLEPLERFDIGQLKLNAIIWDTKNPRAMVQDPNGEIHFIKLRTRIGQKNGFVAAIREGEVVIVEYNQQGDKWVKSFNTLELR